MSAPDLTEPIRDALIANAAITSQLPVYLDSFPIFTRRPVPVGAPYPCIVISKDIGVTDEDGISDTRSIIVRDIAVYNTNEPAAAYHAVDPIALEVRRMFHRQSPLVVPDWSVTLITATGPIDVRLEQDKLTGRVIQLTVRVARQGVGGL